MLLDDLAEAVADGTRDGSIVRQHIARELIYDLSPNEFRSDTAGRAFSEPSRATTAWFEPSPPRGVESFGFCANHAAI